MQKRAQTTGTSAQPATQTIGRRSSQAPAVIAALRTPIGRFLGGLSEQTAADLGAAVVHALLERTGVSAEDVDELIFGNARQAGGGPNVARQISVRAGIPVSVPAWTVNIACGSGLKAIELAGRLIEEGRADLVVAGGTESMSRLPFFLPEMRTGYRLGHSTVVDGMYKDGFHCPLADMLMGETAEVLAAQYKIPREEQDQFAFESQSKCAAAQAAGRFEDEIAPLRIATRKGEVLFARDEHPRPETTLSALAKLPPVFDGTGTVTAGNASGITDGAAALLLASAAKVEKLRLEPLAWLGETCSAAVDPKVMGIGPVPAVRALAERNGCSIGDYDVIELNEAFAAQVLACDRELALPRERLNVNGGSIALGHPIGATGARICATLLHELKRREGRNGLATLCISGGMGLATAFHR